MEENAPATATQTQVKMLCYRTNQSMISVICVNQTMCKINEMAVSSKE